VHVAAPAALLSLAMTQFPETTSAGRRIGSRRLQAGAIEASPVNPQAWLS